MNYGMRFMTLYRRQGSRPSPWKRNAKKAKWLSGEALQIAVKRREAKSEGEKCSSRINKTNLKYIRDTKGTFHAKMGSIKDRNGMDLTEAEDIKKRIHKRPVQKRSSQPR